MLQAMFRIVGGVGLFIGLWLTAPAYAEPVSVNARYVVNIGGTIIADVDVSLRNGGIDYSLDLEANVAGLGQLIARGSATARVAGVSASASYIGEDFNMQTRSSEGTVSVDVRLTNGNVSAFYMEPPLRPRIDQVPIERRHLTGVNDMLSAFVIKANRLDQSICNRRLRIFTGVERFDLQYRYAASENATSVRTGYQGPVVLCQITYLPISGHYTTSEITTYLQASDRILIWYAPIGDSGTFIPYRVLIGTSLGDLSMVLTRLS